MYQHIKKNFKWWVDTGIVRAKVTEKVICSVNHRASKKFIY